MTEIDTRTPQVEVLEGAIRHAAEQPLIAGPVLVDLLQDVVPRCEDLLIVGVPDAQLLSVLYGIARVTTILSRSYDDAAATAVQAPAGTRVVAGSIGAFTAQGTSRFDAVVAVDGVDRISGHDGLSLKWTRSLHLLRSQVRPGGMLLVGAVNPFSLDALLSASALPRGVDRVLQTTATDRTRPTSAAQLEQTLRDEGFPVTEVHCGFGVADALDTLVSRAALDAGGRGTLSTTVVQDALQASVPEPRVISPTALVDRLATAHALPTAASAWLAVAGGHGRSVYLHRARPVGAGQSGATTWLDSSERGLVTGGAGAALLPAVLPTTANVEQLLLDQIARADLEDFRVSAARLGSWVRESAATLEDTALVFDDLYPLGESFTTGLGLGNHAGDFTSGSSDQLLARAWRRFGARFQDSTVRSPWPHTLTPGQLVQLWLGMSGVDSAESAPHDEVHPEPGDLRSQLERSRADHDELARAREQLEVVTALLAARDSALQVRETRIRQLRATVLKEHEERERSAADLAKVRSGRSYKIARSAALLSNPRALAETALGRADSTIRAVRRMR